MKLHRTSIQLFIVLFGVLGLSACATQARKTAEFQVEQSQQPTPRRMAIPDIQPTVTYDIVPAKQCLSLVGVGDIMLGGTANPILKEKGYDYPFDGTRELLTSADITVGNLETALTHGGQPFDKKYTFRNPPEKVIPALQNAGFDLVSLANNHTVDYGKQGLIDTLNALEAGGIPFVGAGMHQQQARAAQIIEAQGQKIGFLGYSLTYPEKFWALKNRAGTAFGHASHIKADVAALKSQVDHVVVQFHWGREGTTKLRPYQPSLGRAAIDAGATLVLGHHPHVLQAIEEYKEGVIYYSLGNFAFGSYSNRAEGGVAEVQLCPHGIGSYVLHPVDVNNFRVHFQPTSLKGNKLEKVAEHMKALSAARKTQVQLKNGAIQGFKAVGE